MTSFPVEANASCWWLTTLPRRKRLHAVPRATLDPHDEEATEELTCAPGPVLRAVCGWTGHMTMPGPFSRLGMKRCSHCCKRLGIEPGAGTPANEAGSELASTRTAAGAALRTADVPSVGNAVRDAEPADRLAGLLKGVSDAVDVLAFAEQLLEYGVDLGADLFPPGDKLSQPPGPFAFAHAVNNATRVGQTLLLRHTYWPYNVAMSNATETLAEQARCLRCGRKLRVSSGYGPTCLRKIRAAALKEARADFTAEQQAKADELIRDGGLVPTTREGVFRAVSSDGTATYLSHACACNCAGGLRAKRPCYHQLAVRIVGIASRRSLAKAA